MVSGWVGGSKKERVLLHSERAYFHLVLFDYRSACVIINTESDFQLVILMNCVSSLDFFNA